MNQKLLCGENDDQNMLVRASEIILTATKTVCTRSKSLNLGAAARRVEASAAEEKKKVFVAPHTSSSTFSDLPLDKKAREQLMSALILPRLYPEAFPKRLLSFFTILLHGKRTFARACGSLVIDSVA